ncbi:hypothetical protein [Serratia marcescens]|uniref:hypothetical protein n=1 Tax=Serratia marcescens TaxID=615 RepID=UPI000AC90072|nr:hypothetical protein [Serratia marcescens]
MIEYIKKIQKEQRSQSHDDVNELHEGIDYHEQSPFLSSLLLSEMKIYKENNSFLGKINLYQKMGLKAGVAKMVEKEWLTAAQGNLCYKNATDVLINSSLPDIALSAQAYSINERKLIAKGMQELFGLYDKSDKQFVALNTALNFYPYAQAAAARKTYADFYSNEEDPLNAVYLAPDPVHDSV